MTTALEGGATAFLPFATSDGTTGQRGTTLCRAAPGSPIFATVASINRAANALTLACRAEDVESAVSREPTHTVTSLKSGARVEATVDRVLPNGLAATFLGFFHATIALPHLPVPAHALWAND